MIGLDETGTLAKLRQIRHDIVNPVLAEHGGRIFKLMGDGMLAEFPSAVQALRAAIGIQEAMCQRNAEAERRIDVRIGVHQGDVVVEGTDLLGDGVNVAARLEALAEPGGICISGRVHEDATGKIALQAQDLGDQSLKNIARPVRAYRVSVGSSLANKKEALHGTPALPLPDKPSLAVLPFQNMSGDPEQEYFADGMVEELTAALSRVRSFFVIARNSTFTYKGRAVDVKQVSRELGVRYVLEGSVRRARDRVRITAQLIDATTGNHIWSDRYNGSIEDIFELQDRISARVVGAIQPSILLAEIERTKRKRPDNLDAYDYVLRALPHVWAFDPTVNAMALSHLNNALEIEPDYPLALSLAAWCHARQVIFMWTSVPAEAKAEGLRLAKLAGDMNNDDPLVLTMLCAAHSVVGDLDIASALIEKALALDPNSAIAWSRSGWLNGWLDRPEIAIEHFQRAIRLSPFDPMNFNCLFGMGHAHFAAARYEEALSWYRRGMLERPGLVWPLRVMIACLGQLGCYSEAREMFERLRQAHPDTTTISKIMAMTPGRGAEYRLRYAEGLRKAGLPE
jgi:adenylate cyclase